MTNLLEAVTNQVLQAQMTEHYVHNDERIGYRNGFRSRQLYTRIGPVSLRVP
jgi:putative transposase